MSSFSIDDSLADRIERTCGRFLGALGINPPKLTASQWAHRSVQRTQLLVRRSTTISTFLYPERSTSSSRKSSASLLVRVKTIEI